MLDLILQGSKANIATLLRGRGLTDATDRPVSGFEACWWAGDGRFMTAKPVYGNGPLNPPTTAATYMAGFVMLARIHSTLEIADALAGTGELWTRSKVAKWIKDNGVLGLVNGMPCVTVASVRLMRGQDVNTFCATNSSPAHEWAGGNAT